MVADCGGDGPGYQGQGTEEPNCIHWLNLT